MGCREGGGLVFFLNFLPSSLSGVVGSVLPLLQSSLFFSSSLSILLLTPPRFTATTTHQQHIPTTMAMLTPSPPPSLPARETRKAADPPPHLFARVSTRGFASYRASLLRPLQRLSLTGLATEKLMTLVASSSSRNRPMSQSAPRYHVQYASATTPPNLIAGIRHSVPLMPRAAAREPPRPLICMHATTTLDATWTCARKAALPSAVRPLLVTSSALLKLSSVVVLA
mmetsp:Transcript_7453/g.15481  ORF Transcript_7453/g.15481 Transcript_7453/m.15481 type:complete len:227 (+) Transcript_7453:65-745(+)